MLSIKCPNCGGTIRFDDNKIATFCSFCGAHLPDMTDYVKQAANLNLEQKRHSMEIETIDREIKRDKVQNKKVRWNSISNIFELIVTLIIVVGAFGIIIFLLTSVFKK